jgi:hypothetical protein
MRRALAAVLAVAYIVAVAAVIPVYGGHPAWRPFDPDQVSRWHSEAERAFADRARGIADQWTEAGLDRWNHRFHLLRAPTITPATSDPDLGMALFSGWFTLATRLPAAPATGSVVFADGKRRELPLQNARAAYEEVANGDLSDCQAREGCKPLAVVGAELTTAEVPTSRGPATVPVWAFTVRELDEPVLQVAVPEDENPAYPDIAMPPLPQAFVTGARVALPPDGTRIDYTVDLRTCDTDVEPLVWENDLVVVLGAAFTPHYVDACSMEGDLRKVSVTLSRPAGDRAIIDGFFGFTLEPWTTESR